MAVSTCRINQSDTGIAKQFECVSPNVEQICYSLCEEDTDQIAGSADWHVTEKADNCRTSNVTQPVNEGRIFSWH